MAMEMRPIPPPPEEQKKSKLLTAEQARNLDKNRKWLAEQSGIDAARWTDQGVRNVSQVVPEPLLWQNRLMVCAPLAELGYSRFWQMLMGTVKGIGWHIDNSLVMTNSGQYLHDTHNTMVKAALEIPGWNYLLFIEHDHSFPTDLLEVVGQYTDPIVSGLYFQRVVEDPQPVAYYWNSTRTAIGRLQPFQIAPMLENRGLYEVDVVPMGCTAIRRDVFENWPKDIPWFASPTSPENGKAMSDDVFFCRHAQAQGYPVKLDSRIIPKHYAIVDVDERMYVAWFNQMKKEGKTGPVDERVWNPGEGNIPPPPVAVGADVNGVAPEEAL